MPTLPPVSHRIAAAIGARPAQVDATVQLLDEGATVPFIARYRKEVTGGLDDTQLRTLHTLLAELRELESRRADILRSVADQGALTPELQADIEAAESRERLEDLYLPYKPKYRSKGEIAKERGLLPLADRLLADPTVPPAEAAAAYVDAAREVPTAEDALAGARDILVERFAQDGDLVGEIRTYARKVGVLRVRVVEGKETSEAAARFRDWFNWDEPVAGIPGHRALAFLRGRNEGVLRTELAVDADDPPPTRAPASVSAPLFSASEAPLSSAPGRLAAPTLPPPSPDANKVASSNAAEDRAVRSGSTLRPAERLVASKYGIVDKGRPGDPWLIETARQAGRWRIAFHVEMDLVEELRKRAEAEAIHVFARNLGALLLAAPAGPRPTLGLDPGLRTGVKVAVVDATGKVVATSTVYPHPPKNDREGALATLEALVRGHGVELVAIGNGTASRETEKLARELTDRCPGLVRAVVSEAGASVYSASELASRELPELDVSLRGAVSIARRLQDPLAELVKIDPRSIGVGQYQHDVDAWLLGRALDATVEDCVNGVGVDLNTASPSLLRRVAGLDEWSAEQIVRWRDQHGAFRSRAELAAVPGLSAFAFQQAAGFLRIRGGDNPLDASAVHPEAYPVVERILARTGRPVTALLGDTRTLSALRPAEFADAQFGEPTVRDILGELARPGRDPRPTFETAKFAEGVETLADLRPGMELEGTVTNVTQFGAFVDVGVHQDGLVHISQLADQFVKDPHTVVRAGQTVKVRVVEVDIPRKRIALTMRSGGVDVRAGGPPGARPPPGGRPPQGSRPPQGARPPQGGPPGPRPPSPPHPAASPASTTARVTTSAPPRSSPADTALGDAFKRALGR